MASYNDTNHPRDTENHDVIIIPRKGGVQRFLVDKAVGVYRKAPQTNKEDDDGFRKVTSIAHGREGDCGGELGGPAFALLPMKPEPSSSAWSCYLVNTQNISLRNPWTVAPWNDDTPEKHATPTVQGDDFEVLLAGLTGEVFHVVKKGDDWTCKPVELGVEADIWNQLRNGVLLGTAQYLAHPDGPRLVPLVNINGLRIRKEKQP